jgi:putative tryptophan/tyrosine transport system substrate-binding protein
MRIAASPLRLAGSEKCPVTRRDFAISVLGAAAVAWRHGAHAQTKVPRLCFLTFDPGTAQSPTTHFKAFFERLREFGYVHGQTLAIDYIAAEGHTDQYPQLAAECVENNPDIIAVTTTPGARALKRATQTIPIVMVALGDPVGTGLVDNLAKPGGNITGTSLMTSALAAKRLQLLKEAVPGVSRVLVLAYLVDPISPLQVQALREAAPSLGIALQIQDIRSADELPAAFEAGIKEGAQALTTTAESIFRAERAKVTELAASHRLPAIYPYAAFALDSGGLMAYEVIDSDIHRSAADYVDMILKGAKPADLPVQQPVHLRIVVNLKTADALGITIPATFIARADEVIE